MKQLNAFIYSTFSALTGIGVYIIAKYLLVNQFDWISTLIIAAFLWAGSFIGYRLSRRRK